MKLHNTDMKLQIFPYETTEKLDVKLHDAKTKLQYGKMKRQIW